jgi:SAM-dependent methyltransferase
MPENPYDDPRVAELYDVMNTWGRSDDFYLPMIMTANSVLDVGCGTGNLLRWALEKGHNGRLVGIDPADAMLDVARRDAREIEWLHGDMSVPRFNAEFDLVYMTGHAFQELTSDQMLIGTLTSIHQALARSGWFVFETRNPSARAWERWIPENAVEIEHPNGGTVHVVQEVELPIQGDLVRFWTTSTVTGLDEPISNPSTLRFLDRESLNSYLYAAGFEIEDQFGDWDRSTVTVTSPEIITIAARRV